MRAALLHGAHDLRPAEVPDPEPAEDETLVAVEALGICGSDLHWYDEGRIGSAVLSQPVVPGHEIGGRALTGPYAGLVVALDPADSCRRCALCEAGKHNLCRAIRFAGDGTAPGGLAERIAWPTRLLSPMPEGSTAVDAALLEPLGVATYAVQLVGVPVGGTVAVVGLGPIGQLVCRVARAAGAGRVVGVDPLAHRREAALVGPGGVDAVLDAAPAREEDVWAETAPDGVGVVYDACGSPDALVEALRAVAPDGDVVLAGIPDGNVTSFPADLARRKGVRLTTVRRMRDSYPAALALLASGRLSLDGLVDRTFALDEAGGAFDRALARDGLKTVIEPHR
ncbi:zinc-binding dehydrogenase [Nocardioides sp. CFH 31398]|uniref:zinc-dependent alcohol dehydrogenase n=1 Tax=Nocardioides sp. CFH 31398 TaxID=2919579 RepID=UPI001F06185B|nr:zinc-binding dehydrogenase [Nocardioides sp. CFH 31398]MCH1868566.1 zinc-binding dehydrogenase [Nocardioides sp. CFH 31398]